MGKVYARLIWEKNWKKYIFVIVIVMVQCQLFRNHVEEYGRIIKHSYDIAVGDCMIDFYRGVLPFAMRGDSEPFNIPAIWSLYFIYFFAVTGQSVSQMLHSYELQMAVRCVSRKRWWKYQNLALWMETAGYLAVTCLAFGIYGLCTGMDLGRFHQEVQAVCNGMDLSGYREGGVLAVTLLSLLFVMAAFAYIQFAVSLKWNTWAGIVSSISILVASVFQLHPFLLGNYFMLIRQKRVVPGGVNPVGGIVISTVVIAAAALAAKRMVYKRDLF